MAPTHSLLFWTFTVAAKAIHVRSIDINNVVQYLYHSRSLLIMLELLEFYLEGDSNSALGIPA
jgi:hypothetical protein